MPPQVFDRELIARHLQRRPPDHDDFVTRLALDGLDARLERANVTPSTRIGAHFAGMMARVLIVALAVIAARFAGDRDDGVMGAALALIAFTVYLGASNVARASKGNVARQ